MMTLRQVATSIEEIQRRNRRVEADKAWETSGVRKIVIVLGTYVIIALYMSFIHIEEPWKNAVIPSAGFFLSTLSLSFIKKLWTRFVYRPKSG